MRQGRRPDLVGGGLIRLTGGWSALKSQRSTGMRIMGDERILGSNDFVERGLRTAREDYEQRTLLMAKGPDLNTLIRRIADYFEIDPESIRTAGKQPIISRARSILCHLAVIKLRIQGAELGRRLNVSPSPVSKSIVRGLSDNSAKEIQKILFED
jgi:putative transposase